LAVVKLTTVQVTKLSLWHKIRNIDMICFAEPVLTEDLCVMQKEKNLNKIYTVCAIRTLDQRPSIFMRQNHILFREVDT
jgi:hypothetical protein